MSISNLFNSQIKVINVGISNFSSDLISQETPVVQVLWRPPAGGNLKIRSLLKKIEKWQEKVIKLEGEKNAN